MSIVQKTPSSNVALTYQNTNAQSGCSIHFSSVSPQDLFLYQSALNQQKMVNKQAMRLYRQVYRQITLFGQEHIYTTTTNLTLGKRQKVELQISGDILQNLGVVMLFPKLQINQLTSNANNTSQNFPNTNIANRNTLRLFGYSSNLGSSALKESVFYVEQTAYDQCQSAQQVILNNLLKRRDQRDTYNKYNANLEDLCKLDTNHRDFKVYNHLKLFFSDSPTKAFQCLRSGQPNTYLQCELRSAKDIICYTRNLKDTQWDSVLQLDEVGLLSQEVFVSDNERYILNRGQLYQTLIEQNIFSENKAATQIQPQTLSHPTKFMYYGVQKSKYTTSQYFLHYEPQIEGVDNLKRLLEVATKRFVLKFAAYKGAIDFVTNVNGFTLGVGNTDVETAANSILPAQFQKAVLDPTELSDLSLDFLTESTTGVILSIFHISGVSELNTSKYSIKTIFERIQPLSVKFTNSQRFTLDNIILQGGTLTVEECSELLTEMKTHVPASYTMISSVVDNILTFQFGLDLPLSCNFNYSTFTNGNFKSGGLTNCQQLFSEVVKDVKFNHGLDDFDICVNDWFNFGKNIDRSGSPIQTLELLMNQQQRFKQSSYYGEGLHQMLYFPGKSLPGINIYSFCIDPLSIQPSGSLNFTKSQIKLNVQYDGIEENDNLIIGTVVNNVLEYKEQVSQIVFATQLTR